MIRILLLTCCFLTASISHAQDYSKSDFAETDWFTDNIDSLFFSSDTVRLIKYMNSGPEWAKDEYAEYEMEYLNHGDFLSFGFNKSGRFEYRETYKNYINSVLTDNCSWKYDKASSSIKVNFVIN